MLRITTLNVNGIRSATKKGLFNWLRILNPDIICFQELKAQTADLLDEKFKLESYYNYFHCADKKGYSGCAIYSRYEAKEIIYGLGFPSADQEGRYVAINLGNLWVASVYLPSGTSGQIRQAVKFEFLEHYASHLKNIINTHDHFVICGDWNIAHTIKDLKNWRGNQKNSGFLPEERAWMDQLFEKIGYFDAFRLINQEENQYTWWSNRGRAWEKNVGWRIDYQIVTPALSKCAKAAFIYKDQRFSDHAPLTIDYAYCIDPDFIIKKEA